MMQRRPLFLSFLVATLLASGFPVAPRLSAAPVQDNAARVWTDTFTDATGVTLVNTVHDEPNERIVLDRTAGAVPTVITSVPVIGTARKVVTMDALAYVAADTGGLLVFDVSNAGAPVLVGSLATPSAQDVAVSGNIAYVPNAGAGTFVIDVSNPALPVLLTTLPTTGSDLGVDTEGTMLAVAQGTAGVRLHDITAPAAPIAQGMVPTGPGSSVEVVIDGGIAYTANVHVIGFGAGMTAVDVSNPAAPAVLGTLVTAQDATDLSVDTDTVHLGNTSTGMRVVDVSNPGLPQSVTVADVAADTNGIFENGGTAYAALGATGVQLVDVSTPATPVPGFVLDTPGTANDLVVAGQTGYVADGAFFTILNFAVPNTNQIDAEPGFSNGFAMSGNRLLVATGTGVDAFTVNPDGSLASAGSIATNGSARHLAIAGNTLFVADGANGLVALDITNLGAMTLLDELALADARDVVLTPTRALVANGAGGVTIIDITDPAALAVTATAVTGGEANAVVVSGTTAYVAAGAAGLAVLDLTNIDAPVVAALIPTAEPANDIAVSGDLVAVAGDTSVYLFDISAPLAPFIVATIVPGGTSEAVSFAGTNLSIATSGPNGVVTYDVSTPAAPVVNGFFGLSEAPNAVLASGATIYAGTDVATYAYGTAYLTSGTATSVVITPVGLVEWNELVVGQTIPANTSITYDILDAAGNPVPGFTGLSIPTGRLDISGIDPTLHPSIRLRANLATTDTDVTPALDDWTVTWNAPCLTATSPVNGATNVGRNGVVTLTFTDPINLATLQYTSSFAPGFTVTANAAGDVVTLTPNGLFPANTVITVSVTFAESQDGNRVTCFTVPADFSFTTGQFSTPYIVSTNPVNGATNVDRLQPVVVMFSDPMNPATVTLDCGAGITFTVAWNPANTVATFTPTSLYPANTTLTCTVAGQGANGTALQPGPVPNPFSFTTGPVARPYIVSTNPANNGACIATDGIVSVTFSDAINPATLTFTSSYAPGFTVTWNAGNTVATFTPVGPLAPNASYTFEITGAQDTNGDPVQTSLVPNPFTFSTCATGGGSGDEFVITVGQGGDTSSNRHKPRFGDEHPDGDDDGDDDGDGDDDDRPRDCVFSDVPSAYWAHSYITEICRRAITNGYPDGTYRPDIQISRAEFLKFVMLANNLKPIVSDDVSLFPDVPRNHTLYHYVQTGRKLGIVTGYADGTYRPNAFISRAEAIKILFNGAGIQVGSNTATPFADVSPNDWFAVFVSFAERNQIVAGRQPNIFAPHDNLTRAEAAKIIVRMLKLDIAQLR